MAVKKFFGADGVLVEIPLPDGPVLQPYGSGSTSAQDFLNPTGVDPTTLPVDAASVPDLIPTVGGIATPKFPDPLPGTGEGPGVGQRSGSVLRDAWQNNPLKDPGTVDTVQSGPVGSSAAVAPADAGTFAALEASWANKDDIRAYIKAHGGEEPHAQARRDELIDEAKRVYEELDGLR